MTDDRHDPALLATTAASARGPVERPMGWTARTLDRLVVVYQTRISPLFPPVCRFHPSCSSYARRALATEPLRRALALTAWRLLRCQPLCAGGDDPVPADRDPSSRGGPRSSASLA